MYDVTSQFFPQFLTFKIAEESVACEDVPSNRMLMDEIRKYGAMYDKSCHEYKDQRVKRNCWQAVANTLKIDVASAQQRYSNIRTNFSKYIKSLKGKDKDESKRKLALLQDDSIHITNETVENCANSICISRQFEYAGDPSQMRRQPTEQVAEHCQLQTATKSQVGRRHMRARLKNQTLLGINAAIAPMHDSN